jgi:hypothetical protein
LELAWDEEGKDSPEIGKKYKLQQNSLRPVSRLP